MTRSGRADRRLRLALAGLLAAAIAAAAAAQDDPAHPQIRILYISSYESGSSDTVAVIDTMRSELAARGWRPEVYLESLDIFRLIQTDETRKLFDDTLRKRYAGLRFNVILAQASEALAAAARYRDSLSPAPPVYCFDWLDVSMIERYSKFEGFYGRSLPMSFPPTIKLAARLFPKAARAYLFASPLVAAYVESFLNDVQAARGGLPGVELVPLVNLDFSEVERTLAGAGKDDMGILLPGTWWLENGEFLDGRAALDRLDAIAPIPYFGITMETLGSGLVGGCLPDRERMGREAAEMLIAILGEGSRPLPWLVSNSLVPTLDYRALKRFDVPASRLPKDSRVLYVPPAFWTRYERQLKALGIALLLVIISLVAYIIFRRRERKILKRANERLEETVEARTEELTHANRELESVNASLVRAVRELEKAKDRAVASEKLAALGRLTASIGHELNTPLAAMSSASHTVRKYVEAGMERPLDERLALGQEARAFIARAMERSSPEIAGLGWAGPDAEREARAEAEAALRGAGLPRADAVARELAEMGIADLAGQALPFLAGPEAESFMTMLRTGLGATRAASIVEDAVAKASRVVAALRTYARSEDGEEPSLVAVAPEARGILDLFRDKAGRGRGCRVDVGEGFAVFARREDLGRILFNLVKNAVQAAGEGGSVVVSAEEKDGVGYVSVADSGPGMPVWVRERIFEPFFSTKPMGEGAGIGLDMARRLAVRNGGDISFRSGPEGTVFTVALPASGGGSDGRRDGG